MSRLKAAVAALMLPVAAAAFEPAHLVEDFPRGQLVLETAGPQCVLLDIRVAVTPEQRSQGLMYINALSAHEGMYFVYEEPVGITMWMQNTPLSLDMIFFRQDGRVARIASDTEPFSTRRIESGEPVVGVLEVGAGMAKRWRVEPGTRMLAIARVPVP